MVARTLARWVAAGRLIPVYRGVYAVGHIPQNPIDRAHAALLAGGKRSALAGESAFVLWGLWKRWPQQAEIVIAGDRRPSGLHVHHSRTLVKRDITVVQGLRVTSAARTLLDMAPRLTEKQLARGVNDLRLRNVLTVAGLRDVLDRNPKHPGIAKLRPHAERAQREPTRSDLEDAFMALIRKHNLPIPRINVKIAGHRVDAHYPDHDLVVELDGWESHKTKQAFVADRRQDAEILLKTGTPTVRLTYDETLAGTAAERLASLLAVRRRAS
jgi:very-short-patch-repair endonuclease